MLFKTLKNQSGGGALILTMMTVLLLSVIISQMPALISHRASDYSQNRKTADAHALQNTIAKVVLDARRLGLEMEANANTNCNPLPGTHATAFANGSNNMFCFQEQGAASASCVTDYSQDGSDVCIDEVQNLADDEYTVEFNFKNETNYLVAHIKRDKINVLKYQTFHLLSSFTKKLESIKIIPKAFATTQNIFEPATPSSTIRNDARAPSCPSSHPLCQQCDNSGNNNCLNIKIDDDKYGILYQQFIVKI